MERITIFDTTLRDGEQSPGATMTAGARVRIARMLADARVDCIEAGFPAASAATHASVAEIARTVRTARIAALARCTYADIEAAGSALQGAAAPRIHVFIATSDLHLAKKLRISREQAIERVHDAVRFARRFTDDIEFSAEDASRTDPQFVAEIFSVAIRAGATTVNYPDTVGYATPEDITAAFDVLRERTWGLDRAIISIHTHDDLGLATANALAAVKAGARQVECTINGIGERAGNAALEEFVATLAVRRDRFPYSSGVRMETLAELSRTVSRATRMPVQKNKAVVGVNAFAHESGIHQDGMLKDRRTYEIMDAESVGAHSHFTISRNSGRHAVIAQARELGIDIAIEDQPAFVAAIAEIAQNRTTVENDEITAIATRFNGVHREPIAV
jgi:2-isopropylmalate synthase